LTDTYPVRKIHCQRGAGPGRHHLGMPGRLRRIRSLDQTRQTNGFLEALNRLSQAAKRKARGYTRFATMRSVLFLIADKLDFTRINPHVA
jgi:hypothetical protein